MIDRRRMGWRATTIGALAAAALTIGIRALAAPPVPDPAAGPNAPKVESTANGTPIVQITNPSAAGVSRNQFTKFDVDAGGLILNNSKSLTETQLAGWVTANPNLCKSASVILNEVTGGDPSQLLGYLEVAGPKAEVVIANSNGITCNGCGFINVSRWTLTTGAPVFGGAGSLDGFRVVGGTIAIDGAGLDGRSLDRAELIARAVKVNAGLWAKQLGVVTGANQVDRTSLTATPIEGAGAVPVVSIDVGALGGMYAGKILLVGTERGVGVTSAGTLASEGELRLETNGDLVLRGPTTSVGAMAIRAQSIDSQGTLYSSGSLRIDGAGAISTAGLVGAQGDVTVQADRITIGGVLGAGLTPDARVTSRSSLSLTAANGIEAPGQQLFAGGAIAVDGASLDLAGARVQGGGDVSLSARAGAIDLSRAQVDAGGSLAVGASGGDVLATDGALAARRAIALSTSGLFDNTRGLVIGDDVQITATELRSQGTEAAIVAASDMRLYAGSTLLNADGSLIYASGDLTIAGAPAGGSGADPVAAGSVLNRSGRIEAGRNLAVYANGFRNEKSVYEVSYDVPPILSGEVRMPARLADDPDAWAYVPHGWDTSDGWSEKYVVTQTETYVPVVVADSAPAQLRSGGNLFLHVANVINDQSLITAGVSIVDQGVSYSQPPVPGSTVVTKTWYEATATKLDYCNGALDIGCETSHTHTKNRFIKEPEVTGTVTEVLASTSQRLENTGTGPSAPGLSSSAPQLTLPTNRLFSVHPDPSSRYLVETDPRFTVLAKYITSDYLLNQLPVHPDLPLKRLGDGFYEEQLVMDELLRATGTPYLPGYGDGLDQYRALMDQGLIYAEKLRLSPGIALSAEQIAQLTLPMVWMVTVRVNGQEVLAPKVYVPSGSEVALSRGGSVVAGRDITWQLSGKLDAAGRVAAGTDLSASAGDVRSTGGVFTAGRDARIDARTGVQLDAATIAAGRDVSIGARDGDVAFGTTQKHEAKDGTLFAGVVGTTVVAGGTTDVRAGRDVRMTAATLQGAAGFEVAAGRDLTLSTATETTLTDKVAITQVGTVIQSAQGSARLVAMRDAKLEGAQVGAAGDVTVAPGGNLSLTATTDSVHAAEQHGGTLTTTFDETAKGTVVQAGGAITLAALGSAGEDQGRLRLEGAIVQAGGQLTVSGNDVQVADAREEHDSLKTASRRSGGLLSRKTVTTRDEVKQDLAVGSLLSGGSVLLKSEGDLLVQGSQVVGSGDVVVRAGGDISILAAEDHVSERHDRKVVRSGLLSSSGGIGITVGTRKETTRTEIEAVSHTRAGEDGSIATIGSAIGSVQGSLVLDAGGTVETRGSDLTAGTDVSIAATDVLVDSVYDTQRTHTVMKVTQDGLTIGVSNGLIDAGMAVYTPLHRATQVRDDRLKALYTLRAAREVQQLQAAADALDQKKASSKEVSVTAGFTHSESTTETVTRSSTALGSSISADGNVTIIARGDASADRGDLTIVGSTIKSGAISLDAARDLVLRSAENRMDTSTDTRSWSASVGVGVRAGGGKAAAGVNASASVAKSKEDTHDVTHTETQLVSTGSIVLRSGRDATLRGAIVQGESIAANVGRDLRLESEQDSSTYHSTGVSGSGQITIGSGASASVTVGYSSMESTYRSVQEQTGLFAGKGGFDVRVGRNTDLRGAVIASEADEQKNRLDTGSLTFSDLENVSEYRAVSASVTIGTAGGGSLTPSVGVPIQGKKASTTLTAVSRGTIFVRSGDGDLSGLSRDTSDATHAIGNIFDKAKVEERQELVQVFGEEGFKAVGDLAQHYTKPYTDAELLEKQARRYKDLLAKGDDLTDAERDERKMYEAGGFRPDNVDQTLAYADDKKREYQGQYDRWKDGSELKTALHAVVGALQAGLGGGSIVAGGVGAGASERISGVTANLPPALRPYASLVIGAAAAKLAGGNGLGAITGGAIAQYGERFNRELHQSEIQRIQEIASQRYSDLGYATPQDALLALTAVACSMVHCSEQLQTSDPSYDAAVDEQARGNELKRQRPELEAALSINAGEFQDRFGIPREMFSYTDFDEGDDPLLGSGIDVSRRPVPDPTERASRAIHAIRAAALALPPGAPSPDPTPFIDQYLRSWDGSICDGCTAQVLGLGVVYGRPIEGMSPAVVGLLENLGFDSSPRDTVVATELTMVADRARSLEALNEDQRSTNKAIEDKYFERLQADPAGATAPQLASAAVNSGIEQLVVGTLYYAPLRGLTAPGQSILDMTDAHATLPDAWAVATDPNATDLQRANAYSHLLGVGSSDLLAGATAAQGLGVEGPVLFRAPNGTTGLVVYRPSSGEQLSLGLVDDLLPPASPPRAAAPGAPAADFNFSVTGGGTSAGESLGPVQAAPSARPGSVVVTSNEPWSWPAGVGEPPVIKPSSGTGAVAGEATWTFELPNSGTPKPGAAGGAVALPGLEIPATGPAVPAGTGALGPLAPPASGSTAYPVAWALPSLGLPMQDPSQPIPMVAPGVEGQKDVAYTDPSLGGTLTLPGVQGPGGAPVGDPASGGLSLDLGSSNGPTAPNAAATSEVQGQYKDGWHGTTSPGAAQNVMNGVDERFLNPNNRFGKAMYVAEDPDTVLAELAHHQATPTHGIRYTVDLTEAKVLDLTDPAVAAQWGYKGGDISADTQAIGARAKDAGFSVIRFASERSPGSVNLAVLKDFDKVLKPQMVTPVPRPAGSP